MGEIEDIRKLSPEERIKRLKKLEEEKRHEIEEADKLLKQSEAEFEEKEKLKREIPIPQVKAVDIDQLFTQEEKQLFAAKRYDSPKPREETGKIDEKAAAAEEEKSELEETVWAEAPKLTDEQVAEQKAYGTELAKTLSVNDLNQGIYDLNKEAEEKGYMSTEMQERKTAMVYAAIEKKNEMDAGNYHASKASEEVLSNLVSAYKR